MDLKSDVAGRARKCGRWIVRAPGAALYALAGVPISVKEAFHTSGWRRRGVCRAAGWTAARGCSDGVAAACNRAIVVGKTKVATILADFAQTTNRLYGRTSDPHELTRSPSPPTIEAEPMTHALRVPVIGVHDG